MVCATGVGEGVETATLIGAVLFDVGVAVGADVFAAVCAGDGLRDMEGVGEGESLGAADASGDAAVGVDVGTADGVGIADTVDDADAVGDADGVGTADASVGVSFAEPPMKKATVSTQAIVSIVTIMVMDLLFFISQSISRY